MFSSPMGDDIVVQVRQSGHLGLLQVTSDLYRVIICCASFFLKPVLDSVVCLDN